MRLNPIILANMLQDGRPLKDAVNRATGRSTVLALRAITHAIDNPGKWVAIQDHEDGPLQHKALARMVADMVAALQLQKFTFEVRRVEHKSVRGDIALGTSLPHVMCTFSEEIE